MDLLRIAENIVTDKIVYNFDIPGEYTDETFGLVVTDLSDLSTTTEHISGSSGDSVIVNFSAKYDNSYRVQLYSDIDNAEIYDETINIVRPYINPNDFGQTASEISSSIANEELARAIIDSVIPQGFYYKKETYETVGLGADYLPLWVDAKKILKVYENNILVFDSELDVNTNVYEITKDKTAIIQEYSGPINRTESAPILVPSSQSDLLDIKFGYRGFPKSFDYRLVLETGHTSVPSDIARATKVLMEDLSCGKLEYPKRYVSAYNTDQYKVQFDKRVFEGTGNLIVDKILSKYAKSITRLGVL
jgi:hypothetical protein